MREEAEAQVGGMAELTVVMVVGEHENEVLLKMLTILVHMGWSFGFDTSTMESYYSNYQ